MVLGISNLIIGWFCFHLPAILAVVFARIALGQIKKSPERVGGKGMAVAGLVTGYIGIGFLILSLVAANALERRFLF
jgi:hypothetical protein